MESRDVLRRVSIEFLENRMKNTKDKPILFLTLGFPGSGKTYFSRRFAKDYDLVHLNSDAIRAKLFSEPKYTQEENKILFRAMDILTDQLLSQGVSVIYDANITKKIYRDRLYKIARKNQATSLLLWFQTSVETARRRLAKRINDGSKSQSRFQVYVNDEVLSRIKDEEEHPTNREKYIAINGARSYKKQKELVEGYLFHSKKNQLKKTGIHNLDLGISPDAKFSREEIYSYLDEKFNFKNNNESSNLKSNE